MANTDLKTSVKRSQGLGFSELKTKDMKNMETFITILGHVLAFSLGWKMSYNINFKRSENTEGVSDDSTESGALHDGAFVKITEAENFYCYEEVKDNLNDYPIDLVCECMTHECKKLK